MENVDTRFFPGEIVGPEVPVTALDGRFLLILCATHAGLNVPSNPYNIDLFSNRILWLAKNVMALNQILGICKISTKAPTF